METSDKLETKIVVLGPGGVGKSALTIRLITNNFMEEYDPTIEDSYRKSTSVDGRNVVLDILDTAGQEEFSSMLDQWMREGDGFILVYAINSRITFEETMLLHQKILRAREGEDVAIVLCGNKCDMAEAREVSAEEGQILATEWEVPFMETSAKTQINNEECFYQCVREVWEKEDKSAKKKKKKEKNGVCRLL